MKALALLALVAACGKSAPSTVTLTSQAPAVGQVSIATLDAHETNTLGVQGKEVVIEGDHTSRQRVEVLEVSATAATKVKVTYEARTDQEIADGKTTDVPSPVAGKTYVVSRDGDAIRATADGGAPVTEDEQLIVADDFADLGHVAGMERMLAGRTWKRGEAVHLDPDQLAELDHEGGMTAGGSQTTAMTLTLTSVSGGSATFTSTMQVETDNAAMALSTTITGTVEIDVAHARPLAITTNVSGRGTRLSGGSAGGSIQITRRSTQRYAYQ